MQFLLYLVVTVYCAPVIAMTYVDSEQRRLYRKFTNFLLENDVKFAGSFSCVNKMLDYGSNPATINADRPVPIVVTSLADPRSVRCRHVRTWRLEREKGKFLLHLSSDGEDSLRDYRHEEVVYVGAFEDEGGAAVYSGRPENSLWSQYMEAVRRGELEAKELTLRGYTGSTLPTIRSYTDLKHSGEFDEWNSFLDLFRETVDGWSLPACAARRYLTEDEICEERHVPGECVQVSLKIATDRSDEGRDLYFTFIENGFLAFTCWMKDRDSWRDTANLTVFMDVVDEMGTRRMLRQAQGMSVDVQGISRLISASRKYTIAALFGNKTWMKDYSYFCFLGKSERSTPVVKELAVTVGEIRPYAFFTTLNDPTISSGDLRFSSGAELREGVWHCTDHVTSSMPMQLEDRIAGVTESEFLKGTAGAVKHG